MPRVLAISSQVARGHVGLSAMVPALQRLGHDVIGLPTILLSNHPGHGLSAGEQVPPELLQRMLHALGANGWLGEVDAVLTGYLPSADHVALAARAIEAVREAGAEPLVVVDPVLGDDPKGLYVDEAAARAVRDILVPLADILTPNRFELGWLSGRPVADAAGAVEAAAALPAPVVVATSIPEGQHALRTLYSDGIEPLACSVRRRRNVANGTGDLLAGLLVAHCLNDHEIAEAVGMAAAGVQVAITGSDGRSELDLVATMDEWATAAPLPMVPV